MKRRRASPKERMSTGVLEYWSTGVLSIELEVSLAPAGVSASASGSPASSPWLRPVFCPGPTTRGLNKYISLTTQHSKHFSVQL